MMQQFCTLSHSYINLTKLIQMDGEMRDPFNSDSLEMKNASGKRLALLLLNGGDGGGPNYITPKSILHILRQRRALVVVFR